MMSKYINWHQELHALCMEIQEENFLFLNFVAKIPINKTLARSSRVAVYLHFIYVKQYK